MDIRIVLLARVERHEIHVSACRSRRSGLVCSTCSDFRESAERAQLRLATLIREAA